ncbi:ATP-binding protein [Streptomyces sp. CNQ085]|uniref:ATP-binding protein n=1 Tax=Streptomyces sp. CNQ085 TaxID=2886944 RepID=UPI001F51345A|nr:ATP-binding protein [Streptomyces sp. CNQ085]MCI0387048.1 ATP-binding protein [Streptomyces sp. CNQ085]
MDLKQVSSKIMPAAKTAADRITNTLDFLSPAFAPFAARWDAEADRRAKLRTPEHLKALMEAQKAHNSARSTAAQARSQRQAARKASANPLATARRAAATADRAARQHKQDAKAKLAAAKRDYPATLQRRAVEAHAVHAVPAAAASWLLSTPADWTVWPASVSAGLIGLNVAALWLGRRTAAVVVDDGATAEEKQLLERLDPSWWVQHAPDRGLSGTVTGVPQLGEAGITCAVRLDGEWADLGKFRAAEPRIRALLGCRTALRIQIKAGDRGGWAQLILRTRTAVDGKSLRWTPDRQGIGVDEVTGEIVDVPIVGTHKLVAGMTNMGKSVAWRPWMMRAVADPCMTGVLLDPKRLEARLWQGRIRTEGHQRGSQDEVHQAIYDTICELCAEMEHRQAVADVTQWNPTPDYPLILVVIEEGAAIVRMSKDKRWSDVLDKLDGLFTLARATGFWIVWATQYPSRTNGGITAQVSENIGSTLALTVDSQTADRVIFGENAAEKGWTPSDLDGIPGRALVKHKGRKPSPVRIWHVTDEMVKALPTSGPVWRGTAPAPASAAERPALRLVKDAPAAAVPAQPTGETNRDKVLAAVRDGATANAEIVAATGLNKGTVSREVKALIKAGAVRRAEDGTLTAGEVSA